jgi:hypothetical protein
MSGRLSHLNDKGDTRDRQHVTLLSLALKNEIEGFRRHCHETLGNCRAQ